MANLIPVLSELERLRVAATRTKTLRDAAEGQVLRLEEDILRLEGEFSLLERVADLFRVLIDKEVLDNAKTAQDLLTEGLQAVFDDLDLSVEAKVDVERGKVSVDLVTVQKHPDGTQTEGMATETYGGSVATVESVLLRVVVLSRRGMRPLLLLDESLGAVAEHYVPRVGKFLSLLAHRMNLDILAVSHNPSLVELADRAYRIRNTDGSAHFRPIKASGRT